MSAAQPLLVAHVIHHLVIGGMENGVVNLINHLPAERFRHAVVCIEDASDFAQRIQREDVEVHLLHRSKIGAWRLRWRLLNLFRRLRPDIVHSRGLSGLDALVPARLTGVKTVHSEHGFNVDDLHGLGRRQTLLRRVHAPLVRRYIAVSKDLQRLMVTRWGVREASVTQIYNGVDTERFVPAWPRRRDVLPAALWAQDMFVVGTVGRLQPVKDQETLLRAFARVLTRRPEWRSRLRLMLVGDGPNMASLRATADELGIASQAWLAGAQTDVPALLQAIDVFVLPSLMEGISNTLLEAMACGMPVLATAVGGNVELVEESVTGATFAPGDVERLAGLIEDYVRNPELCEGQGRAARQKAEQSFSLRTMVSRYQDFYEAL